MSTEDQGPRVFARDRDGRASADPDGDLLLGVEEDEAAEAERTRRRRRRILTGLGVSVLVLLLVMGGGAWFLTERYAGNVDRLGGGFAHIPRKRPPRPPSPPAEGADGKPITFLLVGSDSREVAPDGEAPGARSDAIMIARAE